MRSSIQGAFYCPWEGAKVVNISKLKYERIMLGITVVCEIAAYLLAMLFRYIILTSLYTNTDRIYPFYRVFSGVVVAARVVLFYHYIRNQEETPVWKQGMVEIAATAIKQHFILLILLTLFLYFTRWSSRISRTVMGLLILFGILLDTVSRLFFKNYYNRKYGSLEQRTPIILVGCEQELPFLNHSLNTYGYANKERDVALDCRVSEQYTPEELNANSSITAVPDAYLYVSAAAKAKLTDAAKEAIQKLGCPVLFELAENGAMILPGRIAQAGNHTVLLDSELSQTCDVLGVNYTATTLPEAVNKIIANRETLAGQYICFSNVHTTVMAHEDKSYRDILNGAAYVFPDGKPVAKRIASAGYHEVERVAGPDFMDLMFFATANTEIKHYFYGSTEETIEKLKVQLEQRYPGIKIAGMVSPPFRTLTPEEDAAAVQAINESGAALIWIGLGAPKQEKWMAAHKDKVNGVMLGVGAGFDFHAGTIKRAPVLIQKLGLEWLYRLLQDPGRLFKRYVVTNTKFMWLTRKPSERNR